MDRYFLYAIVHCFPAAYLNSAIWCSAGQRPHLLQQVKQEEQPSGGRPAAGPPRPSTPEPSLTSPPLGAWQAGGGEPSAGEATLPLQHSLSVPASCSNALGVSETPATPPSPTLSSKSTRLGSVGSLDGRGTAARDLLTSLVNPPQGGRGGPLHAAGLLPDPSQLSPAFAGSFGGGSFGGFSGSGFGSGGGFGGGRIPGHQQPADGRPPLGRPLGGKGPRAPSPDAAPLGQSGAAPSGWGTFGAGSLGGANGLAGAAPAADGDQTAPSRGRRASMRVDLAASDSDLLPRMGCPVCLTMRSSWTAEDEAYTLDLGCQRVRRPPTPERCNTHLLVDSLSIKRIRAFTRLAAPP